MPRIGCGAWRVAGLAAGLLGCGQPNPRVIESTEVARQPREVDSAQLSEPGKIRALIAAVRESDATFVQSGQDRAGPEAAEDLERRMARQPAGIPTARQFIDRVASGALRAKNPDLVRMPNGTVVAASDWFEARLAELEGMPIPEQEPAADEEGVAMAVPLAAEASAELGILDALTIVEQSDLRFVAPARKTPKGKVKGKRKEYSGPDFSEMLRRKWEYLGADIHDLDTFVDEIATDAFTSFESYRVVYADGHEEEFRQWLLDRLEAKRQKVARGGSP
jgi:hypothetical protein